MLKINFKPETKKILLTIIKNLFLIFYLLAVVFSAMEAVKPRIVMNYISLELFLLLLLILGIITIAYYQPVEKEIKKLKFLDNLTITLLSVVAGIFTVYLTRQIGWLAILVGLTSAIICYYFTILCYKE